MAVYTALAMAAITWLARRSRTHVVETRIVDGRLVAEETLAVTPPDEVLTEAAAIGTAAADIGTGLHAIIEDLRVQNEALLQRLQNEQQEHDR